MGIWKETAPLDSETRIRSLVTSSMRRPNIPSSERSPSSRIRASWPGSCSLGSLDGSAGWADSMRDMVPPVEKSSPGESAGACEACVNTQKSHGSASRQCAEPVAFGEKRVVGNIFRRDDLRKAGGDDGWPFPDHGST